MADNTVLNTGTGGDTVRDLARQAGTVKTQVMQLDLGGATGNAEVLITAGQQVKAASVPVVIASDQGVLSIVDPDAVVAGTITVTDNIVPPPAGNGALMTGSSPAGSYVAMACPGGDSAWILMITGLTSGTLYYEISIDSTTGGDGNWVNVNGRQTGIVNTVLGGFSTTNGIFRGNTSGAKWIRVRAVGNLIGTPAITIRISSGAGALFLNASIPEGQNIIGTVGIDQSKKSLTTEDAPIQAVVSRVATMQVQILQAQGSNGFIPVEIPGFLGGF